MFRKKDDGPKKDGDKKEGEEAPAAPKKALFSPRNASAAAPAPRPGAPGPTPVARTAVPAATSAPRISTSEAASDGGRPPPPTVKPVVDATPAPTSAVSPGDRGPSPLPSPRPEASSPQSAGVQQQAAAGGVKPTLRPGSAVAPAAASATGTAGRGTGRGGVAATPLTKQQEKDFEDMMNAMNLPAAARAQMTSLPPPQKLDLLKSHKMKEKALNVTDKGGKVKNSPQFFVNQLQAEPDAKGLETLRVCATSELITWLKHFDSLGGIALLVKIIADLERKRDKSAEDLEMMLEAIRCIVAMSKQKDGLEMAIAVPNIVTIIALCLDTQESAIKLEIYEYLSLLCNVSSRYYAMVVDAMETYKYQKREPMKFYHIVQALQHEENPTVQARALQLINSIVSTPSDLDQRVNLRMAFLRLGVRDAMNRVKKNIPHNADYATQFDSFVLDEKEDTAAMQSVIPGYTAVDDLTDDRGMFDAIKKKVDPNNLLQSQFQSVMVSLTRLPTDETNGVKTWSLVSTLLQQVSMGKGYLAVDGEFVLDVQELLNSDALRAELEMTKADNKNLQQSTQDQIKKLREENRALKDELSAVKTAPKEGPTPEEVKKAQQEVEELREQLEEANYNAERAGARVGDLMGVIATMEEKEKADKAARIKETQALSDAHETELSQIWNDRMVEVARKEEEIATLRRTQLDSESQIDSLQRKVGDLEFKLQQAQASGGGGGGGAMGGGQIEKDALLKWAQSQEELSQVRNELNELKKDFLEVNADRAKLTTKAAEVRQSMEEQLLDAKQNLERVKYGKDLADKEIVQLKKELEEAKANVGSGGGLAAATEVASGDAAESSGAPPPPPPPGAEGGGGGPPPPPPPPPPPGAGGFGGPPPPPPPPGGGPPPPPPPPGGGPPPPPPPPGSGPPGPPGPPPPPGAPGAPGAPVAFAAVKQWRPNLPKPAIKVKQLNWEKMPANLAEKSVFNELKDNLENLPIDWGTVEKLFAAPVAASKAAAAEGGTLRGNKEPTEITLISGKRAHAIGIYLRRMAFSSNIHFVVHAIGTFDQSTIDLEFIERLLANAPEPEEVAVVKQYIDDGGDPKMLAKPEQFFNELASIPALKARMTSFKTVLTFKKRADATKNQISQLRDAFDQLINSDRFKQVLQIVLAAGNFLNGRGGRGNATGFKLSSLRTLTDTKTADNKSTLLHWIIQHLTETAPNLLTLAADLGAVPEASGTAWDILKQDIAALKKDAVALANAKANVPPIVTDEFRDAFPRIVSAEVVADYENDVSLMEKGIAGAEKEWVTLATMYGEDPTDAKPELVLADVGAFLNAFTTVRKELMMLQSKGGGGGGGAAALKRKEETAASVAEMQAADTDEIKAQLASGKAFEVRREQRRAAREGE